MVAKSKIRALRGEVVNYKKPPISEAVIELRFAEVMPQELIKAIEARLQEKYPAKHPFHLSEVQSFRDNAQLQVTMGARYFSLDQADTVTVLAKTLTAGRMAPYCGWEAFFGRAKEDLSLAAKVGEFAKIERLGVRYVNRIDVPFDENGAVYIEKYLTVFPQVPAELGNIGEGLARVVIPTPYDKWIAQIIVTNMESPLVGHISFLLDIDLFRTESIPQNKSKVFQLFEQTQVIKNEIFKKCVTPACEELFE